MCEGKSLFEISLNMLSKILDAHRFSYGVGVTGFLLFKRILIYLCYQEYDHTPQDGAAMKS
jgi:hypothetical protein